MGAIVGFITKTLFTEKIIKSVLITLGDYLVKKSSNKLDDMLWEKVKVALNK
jgi:hypothetical protein